MEKGDGGDVDLARSAELCAMALSLEVDKPAADLASEHSDFGRALATLRSLAADWVPEAMEALPHFANIEDEKAKQREEERGRRERRLEEREELERERLEKLSKMPEECRRLRRLEVERCRPLLGGPVRTGQCTDRWTHSADLCTYKHVDLNDLPPHCLHFSRGDCRNGDRCWFNHLVCLCGECRHR